MSGTHMKAIYRRTRTAGAEDVAVTTHDFYDDSGVSSDAKCDQIAAAFVAFWDALCDSVTIGIISPQVQLSELRFYKGYDGDGSPGAVDYVLTYSGKAGEATGAMCPPQVACSVTEMVDSRRHWGRFYIPGISTNVNALALDGTLQPSAIAGVANRAETMYEAWGAIAGLSSVVWGHITSSISYLAVAPPRWRPTWLVPEATATAGLGAFAVQSIRVDEILDIQRRRRWESTQVRETRQLA
jgi:hypothetical protein